MKIEIYTTDGKTLSTNVEDYSANNLLESIKNSSNTHVVIGDVIIQSNSIRRVTPVEE